MKAFFFRSAMAETAFSSMRFGISENERERERKVKKFQ